MKNSIASAKLAVVAALNALPGQNMSGALNDLFTKDCEWHICHPFNVLHSTAEAAAQLWAPLMTAFPDLERRTDVLFGGAFDGRLCGGAGDWVTTTGHYLGTFTNDWLGIPATGEPAYLRFGEFYRVEDGKIVEVRMLLDILGLMHQAGIDVLPKSRGLELTVPGPRSHDGIVATGQDESETAKTMVVLENMIGGLMAFNKSDLASMGMHAHWHPNMMWYGPYSIGTTRAVEGFQRHHQAPFLHAFPDRKGGNHRCRIAEGTYVASTGWPSVFATHSGEYLGVPATGMPITMRVMDWWRREGDVLAENWVMIDIPELLLQMDVDVFALMQSALGSKSEH